MADIYASARRYDALTGEIESGEDLDYWERQIRRSPGPPWNWLAGQAA